MQTTGIRRREFIMATLATGFAVAVQPVTAQTIKTSFVGLVVGAVNIPVSDGTIPAYRAMPASGKRFPVVLVVQEIFGVHEYIQDVCRRLAHLGYLAIAPELFARQGNVSQMSNPQEIITQVVSKVPDHQVMSDLDATVAWVMQSHEGDTKRLGITGFCWGGRIVWLYAAHNPQLKSGVAWYGPLVSQPTRAQPKSPLDLVSAIKIPILGLYGGKDQSIPINKVEAMRQALKAEGNPSEIIVYPEASHGVHADYRPSYNQQAAQDGWKRLVAWFKQHGVASVDHLVALNPCDLNVSTPHPEQKKTPINQHFRQYL